MRLLVHCLIIEDYNAKLINRCAFSLKSSVCLTVSIEYLENVCPMLYFNSIHELKKGNVF